MPTGLRAGKPRVLFLTDAVRGGGAESIAVAQARAVSAERFEKTLLVTRRCDLAGFAGDEERYGVRVACLPRRRRTDVGALTGLTREMRNADIVHAHKEGSGFYATLWRRRMPWPKLLVQLHTQFWRMSPLIRYAAGVVCHKADLVLTVSQHERDEYVEWWHLNPDKVAVVYNGVDTRPFDADRRTARLRLGIDERARVVGAVGRVHPVKGYECFVECAALLRAELGDDACFVVAGAWTDEIYRERLVAKARSLGLGDAFRLLGHRCDVRDLLPAFDVYVLSSLSECLPVALLEAMAAGLPAVATSVGGVPEVIRDGECGLLVPPGDAPALAHAVTTVLARPELADRLGSAARRRVQESFSLQAMARALEECYERVASDLCPSGVRSGSPAADRPGQSGASVR